MLQKVVDWWTGGLEVNWWWWKGQMQSERNGHRGTAQAKVT